MKQIYLILFGLFLLACNTEKEDIDYTQYVDPFIGTADNGHTFPGACAPLGMIQTSPQTGNGIWKYCSGYNYGDDTIQGFAQTHLNGTGVPDLGDLLIYPFSGEIERNVFKSKFDKKTEFATPGYYKVNLSDHNIDVELTAGQRVAFHHYTFNQGNAKLYIDLSSGLWDKPSSSNEPRIIKQSDVNWEDSQTISGHNVVKAWVERQVFYVINFDKPYKVEKRVLTEDGKETDKYILNFDINEGETLQVKLALSTVSIDGAKMNLKEEIEDWNLDSLQAQTQTAWNNLLKRVEIVGTLDQKKNFYTSMYHLYIQPNNVADVDGHFRGVNDEIALAKNGKYYSTLSLWDTYRAAHPLYTILSPELVGDMVQNMVEHQKAQSFLPIWTVWGKENYCMIGNHAVPVIVDAYLKGIKGIEVENAYRAIKTSLTENHFNSDWTIYDKYGYYPYDMVEVESVSRTLESSFDDYSAALMAKALGYSDDYNLFLKRSNYYKNLFDTNTNLMRPKNANGEWLSPFDSFILSHAHTSGGHYTEGNAWQYTWHVQHDVKGLIDLMGGKSIFANKLDSLFEVDGIKHGDGFVDDVTGLIGQYAHGNEPSHHVAYLYNYLDRPHRTQELIREVFDRFYLPKADGLCGNDDCGQMSAWYVFSAMGFYPVNPVGGEYIIGAPQIESIKLNLQEGKVFEMETKNLSEENKYVKKIELNGKEITDYRIQHSDIMQGGRLVFWMSDK